MPQFDPQLIQVMKWVLEDIMTQSAPGAFDPTSLKAYFAECILRAGSPRENTVTTH